MEDSLENRPNIRDNYRSKLEKTFDYYLKNKVRDQPTWILSVGCNFGYEAGALLRVFPTAKYVGVDINKNVIKAAKETNRDLGKVKFQVGDARKRETFGEIPWDIIAIRHPQVLGTIMEEGSLDKDWYLIINNGMEALKEDGILFVSTSSMQERDRVISYINLSKKMKILVNNENKFSSGVGVFHDNFVIVFKKLDNN